MTNATTLDTVQIAPPRRGGRASAKRRSLRVLVTSAGRRVELLACFRAAASALGIDLKVIACDLHPPMSPACREADSSFGVPPVGSDDYVEALLRQCCHHDVSLLVPTIDTELLPISLARPHFEAIGVDVAISLPALISIARDKLHTATFLRENGIPTPRTAAIAAVRAAPHDWRWPLIVKPRHGSAGRHVCILDHEDQLGGVTAAEPMIVQELLRGPEHTVNMFFDRAGAMRCAIPHERLQVRAGEVEKGVTRRVPELSRLAAQLATALPGPAGVLCFQAMQTLSGAPAILEINARFGGGYPLAHRAGAEFAKWLLEERLNAPCSANDDWVAGMTMLRYDAAVFVAP